MCALTRSCRARSPTPGSRYSTWLLLLAALAGSTRRGLAQQDVDRLFGLGAGSASSSSPELRREKRDTARQGRWAFGGVLSERIGYHSNIFLSPDKDPAGLEKDSLFLDSALELAALRYFTPRDRLQIAGVLHSAHFFRDSNVSILEQSVSSKYRHLFSREVEVWLDSEFAHKNDYAVDIFGDGFRRDFEFYSYELEAGVKYDLSERHQIKLSYSGRRKDYDETSGRESLDWWRHGPGLKYRFRPTEYWTLRAWYDYSIQDYDEETASLSDGIELITNPEEEHFYHRALLWSKIELTPSFALSAKYRLRAKDDRFRDFESYVEHGIDVGIEYALTPKLSAELLGTYRTRDYQKRPGDTIFEDLRFERFGASAGLRYQVNPHVSLFCEYSYQRRDTNRGSGRTYRDYDVHMFSVGVSLGF